MTLDHHSDDITDYWLERYRLNELPAPDAARVRERLQRDGGLRQRLDILEQSDREIRASGTLDRLERRITERLASAKVLRSRAAVPFGRWLVPAGLAAAVMLGAIIMPRTASPPADATGEDRVKGLRPAIALYRQTTEGSETLADGDVAGPGDVIRVGYRAAGRPYGLILSIDGRGVVTLHLPPDGGRAVSLDRGHTVLLDRAYELDDAPRWERFYFVTADTAFDVAPVLDAARRVAARDVAALPLPRGFEQSTFSLQKETRP